MAAIPHQLSVYRGPPGDCYLCLQPDEIEESGRPMVTNNCPSYLADLTHVDCVLTHERHLQDLVRAEDRILKCPIHADTPLDLSQIRNLPIDVKKVAIRTLKRMAANALYSACIVLIGYRDPLRTITVAAIEALATGVDEIVKIKGGLGDGFFSYIALISGATLIKGASTAVGKSADLVGWIAGGVMVGGLLGGFAGSFMATAYHDRRPEVNEDIVAAKGALKGAGVGAVCLPVLMAVTSWINWSSALLVPVIIGKGVGSYLQSTFRRFMPV